MAPKVEYTADLLARLENHKISLRTAIEMIRVDFENQIQSENERHEKVMRGLGAWNNQDFEITRLRSELSMTKEVSERMVSEALTHRDRELTDHQREFSLATDSYFKELDECKQRNEMFLREKNQCIAAAKTELANVSEKGLRILSREMKDFQFVYESRKAEFARMRSELQEKLLEFQRNQISKIDSIRSTGRLSKRKIMVSNELDEILTIVQGRRDRAKALFLNDKSRDQEFKKIEQLESYLGVLGHQLAKEGRDLLLIRSKLQSREVIYDARFSSSRTIAVSIDSRSARDGRAGPPIPRKLVRRLPS
jgi:hypothetical protein